MVSVSYDLLGDHFFHKHMNSNAKLRIEIFFIQIIHFLSCDGIEIQLVSFEISTSTCLYMMDESRGKIDIFSVTTNSN